MNFLEDPLTCQTRPIQIPIDLVIEIFSRLPAKSVARCLCLSKFWASVIRSQYFVDLFSAKSSARPQILLAYCNKLKFSFFSADQPSENSSDNIVPTHVTHYPSSSYRQGVPVNGLVCLSENVGIIQVPVIHNPTTGEFLTLPEMKTRCKRPDLPIRNFLGYDPNEKQFKVLSLYCDIMESDINNLLMEYQVLQYQVLTLETEELSWRMIECYTPHIPKPNIREICINGILYYWAIGVPMVELIVCFDVRAETFRFINVNKNLRWTTVLTNYNGKLGLLIPEESGPILISGESRSFELWVLKDAEKQEWLKHVFELSPNWKNVVRETELFFVGMIGTNKVVLSSFPTDESPYIFSYNIRKNTVRKINIEGMDASTHIYHYVFLNHVENLMSLFKFLK